MLISWALCKALLYKTDPYKHALLFYLQYSVGAGWQRERQDFLWWVFDELRIHSLLQTIYCHIPDRYNLIAINGQNIIGSVMWLGANDDAVEGHFVWLPTGTPMIFND